MKKTEQATYLYCAVQRRSPPAVRRAPTGLPGMGAPRAVDAGRGLWLIVADAPLDRYGPTPIERRLRDLDWVAQCALAHEAVVEHFARDGTVIPMKLFTLYSSDARASAHVARRRKHVDELLERVAGRDEWGVRLSVDERAALGAMAGRRLGRSDGSGTGFLLRKKAEKDAVKRLAADGAREAERLFDDLARQAEDTRRRTPMQSGGATRLLLDATFLVPAGRATRFRAAVGSRSRALTGRGYTVTLTGPWPPYHFVSDTA